ncbi:MAG: hypothetical protein ABFC62_08830 [Clostridiaceae bacterium]|nr:hypothetical protein [Eubacteriales bacterium]
MERFIPREKLGKREKKALDARRRATWEGLRPVTRRLESKKLYSRKKTPFTDDRPGGVFVLLTYFHAAHGGI